MNQAPSDRFRDALLDAILPFATEHGWTAQAVKLAADAAGLSQGEALLAVPRGALDLIDAFADRADQRMLARLAQLDLPAMRIRDKVRAAVRARLETQAAAKGAAKTMTRALVRHPGEAARLLWRTSDRIWRALGDPSTDGNFYSKRTILSGVLASTYARWFTDDDPESAATWAFLDARIENVMQFEKLKARTIKPLGEMAEGVASFAARLRYGRG